MQSSLLSHTFTVEFPELKEAFTHLKTNDEHFKRLFSEYEKLDHDIVASEENVAPMGDDELKSLKVKRDHVKRELFTMATAEKNKH